MPNNTHTHTHTHICCCCLVTKSCATLFWPHGPSLARFLCPWDFPGKNTGVGWHFLLHGIFLTQGSNLCLQFCRWILYHWASWEAHIYTHTHTHTHTYIDRYRFFFRFFSLIGYYKILSIGPCAFCPCWLLYFPVSQDWLTVLSLEPPCPHFSLYLPFPFFMAHY